MKIKTLSLALALVLSAQSWGAAIPNSSRYDSRMQQVSYNAQNSTVIHTRAGYVSTLVFADDETVISDPEVGFEKGWKITKEANRVSIRPEPIVQPVTDIDGTTTNQAFLPEDKDWKTNLFVTTSKHFYSLELRVIDDDSKAANQAFVVTWHYPNERRLENAKAEEARQKAEQQALKQTLIDKAFNAAKTPKNWDYTQRVAAGSENIKADFAYDDGRFTYLGFSALKKIPSAYPLVGGNEQMTRVSFKKYGNYRVMVIPSINPKLILRYGTSVVGIENNSFGKVTVANGSTVSPNVELEVRQ